MGVPHIGAVRLPRELRGSVPGEKLAVWSSHVLPASAWASSQRSSFSVDQQKEKKTPIG